MTQEDAIDLSVIDTEELEKLKGKQQRANRVQQVIRENGLDKDEKFMNEINPLIEELLKK